MTYIEMVWYGFWTGAGSLLGWVFAARFVVEHTSAARLLGAIAGLVAAHILPRVLVHYLIEVPRRRSATAQGVVALTPAPVGALPSSNG